jgi:ABC-type multidrug transport system fused ATPase/permease subunit
VTLIGGLIVAFTNGWKLSLVVVACLPVIAVGAYFQTKMQINIAGKVRGAHGAWCGEKAARVGCMVGSAAAVVPLSSGRPAGAGWMGGRAG